MESKKVFVGSLYEFGLEARATTIAEYGEHFSAGAAKPFISYDERTHLFSFTCDRTDSTAVSNFFSSIYAYVDVFEKKPKDLVHSPLLIPMKGTVIEDALILDENENSGEDLLGVGEDSDSEFDGHPPTHNTSYWAPREGSSKMLTRDVARAITEATEADLFPEHDRNRVVIMGGDAGDALTKLTNLEPLMDLLAQQSKEGGHRPSANVLMLPALDDLSTLDFKFISTCPLATERIVVDLRSRPFIANKSVTQILNRGDRHSPWFIPGNMTEEIVRESATSTEGFCQIWNYHSYSAFGDHTSARPVPASSAASMPFVPPAQKFVTASKAHDIGKWTENIDEGIDPEAIAVEAPFETVATPGRQRMVREDSDDEGEEEPGAPPPPATKRVVLADSDDDAEEIVVSAPAVDSNVQGNNGDDRLSTAEDVKPSRLRGGVLDYDDEDGHSTELSSHMAAEHQSQAILQPTWTSNPFSVRTQEEGEGQGALSERESTILALPPSSPQGSSPPQLNNFVDAQASTAQMPEETGASEMPASPSKFPSRDEFDPNRYGKIGRGGYVARGTTSASQGMEPPSRPMALAARGGVRGRPPSFRGASSFRGRGAGCIKTQPNYSHPELVQLSATSFGNTSEKIRPPPGLEFGGYAAQQTLCSIGIDLLDGPLDNIQCPSIKPSPVETQHSQEPLSASTKRSSNSSSANSGSSYVNTYNPPRDLAKIENDQLAKLRKLQEETREKKRIEKEAEKLKAEAQVQSHSTSSHNRTQRRQRDDEISSRQFHSTMRQQAPKPGNKGKQGAKKMTEKEKKQRLNYVLGNPSPSGASFKQMPPTATDLETMSTRKKQALKKNPNVDPVAAAHLAANQLSSKQTSNLIQYLNPLFTAGRGFPGQLKFEIQFGQVLIANSKDFSTGDVQLFSIKKWESVFSPPAGKQQPVATTFTNILTRNGHDVDRMLQMKPPRDSDGRGPEKLFDWLKPGPSEISYEFHCQSKESEEFWIVVDGTGKYSIRKSTSTVGMVNLHYPANIWDARVVLHGTADFCEPEEETAIVVASFMESVYVPAQESLSITYRQPAENDMTVRSVTVKRTSLHNCNIMDRQDSQLQVVEVKDLFHRFHNRDKKLTQAFEKGHQEMLEHDRIHYEVSLVHKSINEMLKQNRTLKTGDLATGASTGKQLLKPQAIQNMLDLVSHIVSKIDWVGVHNNGTLLRNMQEEQYLAARVATAVPGTRPAPSFTGMTSTAAGGTAIQSDIHGIRINTKAELGCDADGKPVLIGMGGAMIPIPTVEDELRVPASELAPNDSASNIGVNPGFQTYVPSAAFARGLAARGPNFW